MGKMKANSNQQRLIKSSTPRKNFYDYYKAKSAKNKQIIKMEESNSEASSADKKIQLKKKLRHPMKPNTKKISKNGNWIVYPDGKCNSESSLDEEKVNDMSAIYYEEVNSSEEEENQNSRSFTSGDFDRLMEETADYISDDESNNECDIRFFQKMKEENFKQYRSAAKRQKLSELAENIQAFPIPSKNSVVCLLSHPTSTTLHGYVSVEVLSGCVSICGHEITPESETLRFFSSMKTGLIECKTEKYDHLWKHKDTFMNLNHKLKVLTSSKEAQTILSQLGNTSVVIIISLCIPLPHLQFVGLYHPEMLAFHIKMKLTEKYFGRFLKKRNQMCYIPNSYMTVTFSPEVEDLSRAVNYNIQKAKIQELEGPRVLIFGPKNSGKSTVLQFLMNKALTKFSEVFYLDTDPGQPEFTPPGSISLVRVTKPVFGPPFCHQRKPVVMCFTGSVSAETSIDMYNKSVMKVSRVYAENFADQPLFINTMGWVKGLGLECLKNILQILKPTVLVEVVLDDDETMLDFRPYLADNVEIHQIQSHVPKARINYVDSKLMRSLSILSYFGKCQHRSDPPKLLNGIRPICVCWDKIAICLSGKSVPPSRLVESLNASVVALCKVPNSVILESNIPEFPTTLEKDSENECIGYGIVTAIDEGKHLLYIVTPLSLRELKRVNAIIKGNITLPERLLLCQEIYNVPLPFTDEGLPGITNDDDDADESMTSCINEDIATVYRRDMREGHKRGRKATD